MVDTGLLDRLTGEAGVDGVERLVVGGLIVEQENVLLLKRPAHDFMGGVHELPSGEVEPGEALDAALAREVREETGLAVARIGAYLGSFDYTSGSGRRTRQFTFLVAVAAPEPVVLREHDEHTWLPVDGELPVTDAVKRVVEAYRRTRRESR